jgi:hypothetical protein
VGKQIGQDHYALVQYSSVEGTVRSGCLSPERHAVPVVVTQPPESSAIGAAHSLTCPSMVRSAVWSAASMRGLEFVGRLRK